MSSRKLTIIDDDFILCRCQNGIQLIPPDTDVSNYPGYMTEYTVAEFSLLPMCSYFEDVEDNLRQCNELSLEVLAIDSKKNCLGRQITDFFDRQTGNEIVANNRSVMGAQRIQFFDETVQREDEDPLHCLSIKFPWYREDRVLMGIFGCSLFFNHASLAEAMECITKTGLLNDVNNLMSYIPGVMVADSFLTKRESMILAEIVRGGSARTIAHSLQISPRTVEVHVEHIKQKMQVESKKELIEKFFASALDKN